MSYCTLDDLKQLIPGDALVQLTDDEGTGTVAADRVNEAIAQADGEIDAWCGTRYVVPFAPVPEIVRKCSVDMAIYNLYSRRVEELPAVRAERYKNAIRTLEGLAGGTISPGMSPGPAASGRDRIESTRAGGDRVVTRRRLKGF